MWQICYSASALLKLTALRAVLVDHQIMAACSIVDFLLLILQRTIIFCKNKVFLGCSVIVVAFCFVF